jgi:hypothetical protein
MLFSRKQARAAGGWLLTLLAVFTLSWLGIPFIGGERAGLLEDDAYFYAQIAFNYQRLGFFTFDGLASTSGFHPLWMGLLSGLAQLVGLFTQDKSLHLSALFTLWFALVLAVTTRVGKTPLERIAFFGIALLTTPLMETALLSLLLLLAADRILRPGKGEKADIPLFVATFLVPLTRIDAAPFLLLWLPLLRRERALFIAVAAGLAAGSATHFLTLEALFGHPYSVSSLLKSDSFRRGLPFLRALAKSGIFVRALVLGGLSLWAILALRRAGGARTRLALVVAPPVLFTLTHMLVSDVRGWYFLPGYVFAYWAGANGGTSNPWKGLIPAEPIPSWHRRASLLVAATALLLNAYKVYRFVPLNHVRSASWDFVHEARELLPADARLYQVDGSGFTGYWLDRQLINGDGLVNTYEYARRLKDRKLAGYLEEQAVCYLITDAPISRSQKNLVDQRGLVLGRSAAEELLRSRAYGWSTNRNAHFILWRLRVSRCG